jgi:metal-responsive CopG/Arc/MetJ family transcriptional regulator
MMRHDKHRLHLDLSLECWDRVDRLVELLDTASRAEAVRRALEVAEVVLTRKVVEQQSTRRAALAILEREKRWAAMAALDGVKR